ncbi:TOBE domain-containing protein [Siccirubricoccus sp. KC 17139]|uniref:TOBE domain-containing protein n=1 Tax=Siccirubricoccus soli TaxID=2899147 RepID=A0ABT1D0F3_9PROT|nr:TOBE domain-containing protein [Siccirubricoccus soli]MCO6414734.1 TOBE domain-containing protein [Siccirubricoccus soli]MCP2680864.1 TOBE domain-containing protein [Siccirubricoccus soli]
MGDSTALLELEGLSLPAAGLGALDLRLMPGEVVALLGAGSGAALAVLAGQARAVAGRVRLPAGPPGLLPPPAALFRNRSVLENLAPALATWPAAERSSRAARLLAQTGLEGQEGKRPSQLSPAQQLRLCLARALAPAPRLLLLDDPLAGLDPTPRRGLALAWRGLFRRLGLTVLLTTPEAMEAMALADRILVLEDGEVVQEGPPQALYEAPATAFVAGLVGENNRLPGTVLALEEDMARVKLDCGPELEARLADAGGPGSRCIVAVRPEKVAVAAMSAEELGEGAVPAALREVVFLGPEIRLVLEIGTGGVLVARRPPGGRLPRPGGPAAVAWDGYAAFAYREPPMILLRGG